MSRNLYALLVGINDYPAPVPRLYGCVNDVNAFEAYLSGRVAKGEFSLQLHKLLDKEATRQAVIDGFRQHLRQAGPDDVALFYYTGHGSQEPAPEEFWPIEPDHLDETLVCWDSRTAKGLDLADKELALLISEVAEKGSHVVMIMDCCHSGSGTREVRPFTGIRQAPADTRPRRLDSYLFPAERMMAARAQSQAEQGATSGWLHLPQGRHILLAACQDIQTAKEHFSDGKSWGAFSFFLRSTLESINGSVTYHDLFKQAQARVRAGVRDQNPQLEASQVDDLDQPFLGGAIQARPSYFTISFDGTDWRLDGGAIHGLPSVTGVDTIQLSLFPLDAPVEKLADLSQALGQAEVVEVQADSSRVQVSGFEADPERTYKAVITGLPLPPIGVKLEGDEEGLTPVRQVLEHGAPGGGASLYVREEPQAPQLRLLAKDGLYTHTRYSDERPLCASLQGYGEETARQAVQRLEHIARWQRTADLTNPGTALPPKAVSLHVLRDGMELGLQDTLLEYRFQGGQWQKPSISLRLVNNSDRTLYCTVLGLEENFAILPVLPQQPVVKLDPGQEYSTRPFTLSVPDDLWQQGITDRLGILKLIACSEDFDATLLKQGKLDEPRLVKRSVRPPGNTLNRLMNRVQTREFDFEEPPQTAADWTTDQVALLTRRPLDTIPVPQSGQGVPLGRGVTLEAHPRLEARARLGNQPPTSRDLEGPGLPALFEAVTAASQPFSLVSTRSANELDKNMLEFRQVQDHTVVTPQDPLKLSLNFQLAPGEHVLAYGYDGEFFIPLGTSHFTASRQTQIELQRLPPPLSYGARDLGGAVRIFFQKLASQTLGLPYSYPILAAATVAPDGSVAYEADPSQVRLKVAAVQDITLYIHGFTGDTRGMAASSQQTHPGDLVLTFDYESINTSVEETARSLKARLETVGLGAGHGKSLRIVAHSLGGLVVRWFIEREGGDRVVQRLVIAGSPSAGVPWVSLQQWATLGLTLALNGLAAAARSAQAVVDFLTAFEKSDVTLDQLQPDSELLKSLAAGKDPGVPYTLLAGNTSLIPEVLEGQEGSRLGRLLTNLGYDLASLGFFGRPNDIAVSVDSVFAIPEGRSPAPEKAVIACDHLSYFNSTVGLEALKQVLS